MRLPPFCVFDRSKNICYNINDKNRLKKVDMAKKPPVICLYCSESFKREECEHIQVGRRYAHTECSKIALELFDFLQAAMGEFYSPTKVKRQLGEFAKEGYKLQDISDTLHWWYEVRNENPERSNGGIGIFTYIFEDYKKYKKNQEKIDNIADGKNLYDYADKDDSINIIMHPTPIRRPKRVKLFSFE